MHACSISPPDEASSTMKSTSFMVHAVDVHRAVEASKLHPPALRYVHAHPAVAAGGREGVGVAAKLNHRRSRGRIVQDRWSAAREKTERVAATQNPSASILAARHLNIGRVQLAAAMDV